MHTSACTHTFGLCTLSGCCYEYHVCIVSYGNAVYLDLLTVTGFCLNNNIKSKVWKSKKTLMLLRAASYFTCLVTETKDFVQLYLWKMLWLMFDTFCLPNIKFWSIYVTDDGKFLTMKLRMLLNSSWVFNAGHALQF